MASINIKFSNKRDSGKIDNQYRYEFSMLDGAIDKSNFNIGDLGIFDGDQMISSVMIDNIRSGDNMTINKKDLLRDSRTNPNDFNIDYLHITFS